MRCRSRQTGVGRAALMVALLMAFAAVLVGGTTSAGALDRGVLPQESTQPKTYPPKPPITTPPKPRTPSPTVAPSSDNAAAAQPTTEAPAEVLGETENRAGGSGEGEGGGGESGASEDRSIVATGLATVVDLSPGWVAASAGLSALLILLLLAASQLFNDALKNHHDEIVRQLADRTTILGRLSMMLRAIPNPPVVATFAATAGLLGLLANPGVNFSVSTLAQMVGMMLAIGAIALVYDGIARRVIDREIGVQSRLRLYPLAILVAVICLLLSRFLSVSPGVLYGLFIGIAVGSAVSSRLVGRAYATSSLALIGVAVLAFLLHKWVAPDAGVQDPSFWAIVMDTAAAVLVVGGLQSVIVQLIPARFLYGEDIFKWSRAGWAALAVTAMTVYMVIVVRPNPNQQSFGNLWFVLGLVAVAILFWTWATFHHRKLMREKAAESEQQTTGS